MSKPYDAATKRLIELRPEEWVRFLGLPSGPVTIVDADLSTVTLAADRLIQVDTTPPYVLHLELESGKNGAELPQRLLRYNVNAEAKVGCIVLSAVLLLRRESDSPALTGPLVRQGPDGTEYLRFHYSVVRVWQLDPVALMEGGLSTLPLLPISNVSVKQLPALLSRMDARFQKETTSETEMGDLWTATYILMGLRYNNALNIQLLQGVRRMRESVSYQAILEEGREEGRVAGREEGSLQEARRMLIRVGIRRLGPIPTTQQDQIQQINRVEVLETLLDRVFEVESWDDILPEAETESK